MTDIKRCDKVRATFPSGHTLTGVAMEFSEDGSQILVARGFGEHWLSAENVRKAVECDGCYVHPDGTRQNDGAMCPCAAGLADPQECRCQPSPAEWLGPTFVRTEIAAEEA